MTAALHTHRPSTGFDRLVLATGLALVSWSRRRAERRPSVVTTADPAQARRERAFAELHARSGLSHTMFR